MSFDTDFPATFKPIIICKCPEVASINSILRFLIKFALFAASSRMNSFLSHLINVFFIITNNQATCSMVCNHYSFIYISVYKLRLNFF